VTNVKISIIIPTLNEEKYIGRCLESIKNQTCKDYEIIVVDGYSKDKTVDIAKKIKAKIIKQKPSGFAKAKNEGARHAKGDILCFIDADSAMRKDHLERLSKCYKNESVMGVGGPLRPDSKQLKHRVMYFFTCDFLPLLTARLFHFYQYQSANTSFRRNFFEKIGGFNENLEKLEDNEIANRARKHGKLVWARDLYVTSSTRRVNFGLKSYVRNIVEFLDGYFKLYILKKQKLKYREKYTAIR
jgi:glycosyltransferase involved in cell wall biosynthesis